MKYDFFINGEFKHYTSKSYNVYAPDDLRLIAEVPDAGEKDVNEAVKSANEAYCKIWKFFDPGTREKLLWKWAEVLEKRADTIGEIAGIEAGRSGIMLADDLKWYANMIRYYAGFTTKNYGDLLEVGDGHINYVIKEPLGVVAAMVPWNSAITGAIQKLAPALAAGNTVLLRCSDEVPLATLLLGEVFQEAGFPPGVVNIIAGMGPESGIALTKHPDVRIISFTGSVPVGQAIMQTAAIGGKRCIMELGGKSPMIVFADADLEKAAQKAVEYAFIYQGQVCCAVTRIIVEKSIKDEFIKMLKENTEKYQPAYSSEISNTPSIGPLFNEKQFKQVETFFDLGKRDGKLITGGERITHGKFANAFYYKPTIFEFKNDQSEVCKKEIFGPILSVLPFDTKEEAAQLANNVEYALSSSVWSKDLYKLNWVIKRIEAGTVWVNNYWQFNFHAPWGGFKNSGMGREYGKYAMEDYYEYKNVWLNP